MTSKEPIGQMIYQEYTFTAAEPWIAFTGEALSRFAQEKNFAKELRFSNCTSLGFCRNANGLLMVEGRYYRLHESSFFVIPPYAVHSVQLEQNHEKEIDYLCFDESLLLKQFAPESVHSISNEGLGSIAICYTKAADPFLFNLVSCLMNEISVKTEASRYSIAGLLLTLMTELHGRTAEYISSEREEPNRLLPALQFLKEHYMGETEINHLASMCGLSTGHFRREFKETLGLPLNQYINHLRIRKACSLLMQSESTILEIAMAAGFRSLSAFNSAFRKQLHTSPKAWRDSHRIIHKTKVRRIPYHGGN